MRKSIFPASRTPANGAAEGLLSITDDRSDGQLRDPAHPLRLARGHIIVPRSLIHDMHLRPGLLLRGPVMLIGRGQGQPRRLTDSM